MAFFFGERQRALRCFSFSSSGLANSPDGHDTPAETIAFLQAIDPGHGVSIVFVFFKQSYQLFQVGGFDLFLFDIGRRYFFQFELNSGDHTC